MLHELATNAVKHGALRSPNARVSIEWTVAREAGGSMVHLVWRERGGPPVVAPSRSGFGTRLLKTGAGQLGGRIEFEWATEGACRLVIPAPPPGHSAPHLEGPL